MSIRSNSVAGIEGETLIYRSSDGGLKWEKPVILPLLDREYLAVDQSSGKYRGRIYLTGNTYDRTVDGHFRMIFLLLRSVDGGMTFQPTVKLLPDATHMPFGISNGDVLSDGIYVAAFPEVKDINNIDDVPSTKPVGLIKMVRSENGGDSFAKAEVISPWYQCRGAMVEGLPMIAADLTDGPFKDRIYVVWSDKQSGHCDVRFSYSTDKGKTWPRSRIITDAPHQTSPHRFRDHNMPFVAATKQGVIAISWYDRRDSPDDIGWWTRFTASLDGGETFLPSVKVSEAPEE